MQWLVVFLGGGLGALMRFGIAGITGKWWNGVFPLATLLSNVLACLILGFTVAVLRDKLQNSELWYTFIVMGICGGFSTFSSFAKENLELFEKGNYVIAAMNILASVALCIAAVYLARK